MDTIPANLCTLVEQLEDSRQFHHAAAQQSVGDQRERHRERALAYAAMLAEICQWESRNSASIAPQQPSAAEAPIASHHLDTHLDDYAALLERVYRIHSKVEPVVQAIQARATGNATDGQARDGRRRAGASAHC